MGERIAAVPGLCRARLVVAVVVFVCAHGRCHVRAGRRHLVLVFCGTRSGCCCGLLVILVVVLVVVVVVVVVVHCAGSWSWSFVVVVSWW